MNKFFLTLLAFALAGAGIWYFTKTPAPTPTPTPTSVVHEEAAAEKSAPSADGKKGDAKAVGTKTADGKKGEEKIAGEKVATEKPAGEKTVVTPATPTAAVVPTPAATAIPAVSAVKKPEVKDGVDGDIAQPGDDGDLPPPTKAAIPSTLAGVKNPKVWLVSSDLQDIRSSEVGVPDGSKSTPWKNRAGAKYGNGVRVGGSSTGTFIRSLATTSGAFDAVMLCAPGVGECVNTRATQLKVGLDINHKEHWLSGADKVANSSRGGSSFTSLFVAVRGSANANPLLEHQNGEAGANKGVFFGWIGPDLVGSIHGVQGVVGVSALKVANAWNGKRTPEIYTLRYDRKKQELKIFALGEKNSEVSVQALESGDGPDNDQYASIALGSKNPGPGAVTFVLEQATYSRALDDKELCAIHKEWNTKYSLKVSSGKLKPCD